MMEASATAEYIRLHPEHYEDFVEWYFVEKSKELEFLKMYLPLAYASLDDELVQATQEEFERVSPRFGRRSTWCKHNLAVRAEQTGYSESYKVLNPIASGFVHVTPYGMQRRFSGEDRLRIDVPPSISWVEQSLVSGHALTLGMVHTLIRCFHPEQEGTTFRMLENDYSRTWSTPSL